MAGRTGIDAFKMPRPAINELEFVSIPDKTSLTPPDKFQSTEESLKVSSAALPSNGALHQKNLNFTQPDYYAAARAEMNAEILKPSEIIDGCPTRGENAEMVGRYSPSRGYEYRETSIGLAQNRNYQHDRGSTRPNFAHISQEEASQESYYNGSLGPPPTGFTPTRGYRTFSPGHHVAFGTPSSTIDRNRYDGFLTERVSSDHGQTPSLTGELSNLHRHFTASPESCVERGYFYRDGASSPETMHLSRGQHRSYAADVEDDDRSISTSLFVEGSNKNKSTHPCPISNRDWRHFGAREINPDFSHDSYANLPSNQNRYPARQPSPSPSLTVSGGILRHEDSKYSGVSVPWRTNIVPRMTPGDEISDASLQKRGLKRGQGDKVCKRGYGANDPENIAIVNMKEKGEMSFQAIADSLNKQRVAQGRKPTLSVCGIAGRYNRTAPLLFASQGKIFVPLSERRTSEGEARHGTFANLGHDSVSHRSISSDDGGSTILVQGSQASDERPVMNNSTWNGDLDILLVHLYKEYDANRWQIIAREFTDRTGMIVDAGQVALRHAIL